MKKLFLFLLIYGFVAENSCERNLVAPAVAQIIRDFYLVQNDQFDIVVIGDKGKLLSDIVDQIGKLGHGSFPPFSVFHLSNDKKKVVKIFRSAILMFDGLKSYQDFHARVILAKRYHTQFNFLVVIHDLQESQASRLILNKNLNDVPFILQYESFLVRDSEKSMKILTISMFQQPKCRDWITTEVNRFSVDTRQWDSREFFPKEFSNFNGCHLTADVSVPNIAVQYKFGNKKRNSTGTISGYGIDFLEELARSLNFSLILEYYYNNLKLTNRSLPLNMDFYYHVQSYRRITTFSEIISVTHHITTDDNIVLISRFKPYDQFDKLILPFDDEVWFCLIVTLVIAVITIIVVRFASIKVQRFVFGRYMSTPMLNLL